MAARMFILLLLAFATAGCVKVEFTKPYDGVQVDSVRKAVVIATAELRAANFLLQDLVYKRSIGKNDAQKALNHLKIAKQSLAAANTAIALGDAGAVQGKTHLDRAIEVLDIVLEIMAPYVEPVEQPTAYFEPWELWRAA